MKSLRKRVVIGLDLGMREKLDGIVKPKLAKLFEFVFVS